jgi:hypothetical protein
MKKDSTLARYWRSSILRGFLLLIPIMAGVGCVFSTPAPPPPTCTPEPKENIYLIAPPSWRANTIFEHAYPVVPTSIPPAPYVLPNGQNVQDSRYLAFRYLVNETKRLTDIEVIKLDDGNEAEIIITFISPELLRAVYLNETLKNHSITSNFQDQSQIELSHIAERNELMFLLTVTTTNNMGMPFHVLKIPIHDLSQVTSDDSTITPSHNDNNLEQQINSTSNTAFGYIAFPLSRWSGDKCALVLDPKYNTNIVLNLKTVNVDTVDKGPFSWTFPYKSLIDIGAPLDPSEFILDPSYNPDLMPPSALPPIGLNRTGNWKDYSWFLWYQIARSGY